jgi:hypothetical protein
MPEDTHPGIPTRAIHEQYVAMQGSLQQYRTARDQGQAVQRAHGDLQRDVLTFYELLRPHLKAQDAVSDWWEGKLPVYKPSEPEYVPDPDDGRGILQIQTARRVVDLTEADWSQARADGPGEASLKDWHDALGLNGGVRVEGVAGLGDSVLLTIQEYQLGLRQMDDWETKYQRKQQSQGGFMSDKRTETVERQRIPADRLIRAARELSDVADRLGALSEFDVSGQRTEITDEQIERLEEWRQEQLG